MGVSFDEFTSCDSNLATNRQTRMLSDLALIGCYNKSSMSAHDRDRIMLASAKRNLAAMSYFGLTEHQKVKNLSKFHQNSKFIAESIPLIVFRYHNMYLKKHLIYVLQYHSINTIQLYLVQH